MYSAVDINSFKSKSFCNQYKDYKLCYIDEIPETYYDWDEQSKKIIESKDFDWGKKYLVDLLNNKEYNNPSFIPGVQELYAYFTPLDLTEQWGDDWNDFPYEHNAGIPYDHGNDYNKKINILMIPFYVPEEFSYLPKDRSSGGNSPFSVRDINMGAIPWIFLMDHKNKKYDVIPSGEGVFNFVKKVSNWKK